MNMSIATKTLASLGFQAWRLERYFANKPPERLNPTDGSKG
jgi:hypothetical protein